MSNRPRFRLFDGCAIAAAFIVFGFGIFEGYTKNAIWMYVGTLAATLIIVIAANFSARTAGRAAPSGRLEINEPGAQLQAGNRPRFTLFDGLAIAGALALLGSGWYMEQLEPSADWMFTGSLTAALVLAVSAIVWAQRRGITAASGRFSETQKACMCAVVALLQCAIAFKLPWTALILSIAAGYAILAAYFTMRSVRRRGAT